MQTPHYEIIGDRGKWLTLLHGTSQHMGLFNRQVEHFRSAYRLLLIDLPGHGKSSLLPGSMGQREHMQAVVAALDAAGVQRTHLWGTHTGAAVSLLIASKYAKRVSSLILEGAVLPGMPMPYVTMAAARARATAERFGAAAAVQEWFSKCDWFDVIRKNGLKCRAEEHYELLQEFNGRPWLEPSNDSPSLVDDVHLIQHPTLLVNGEHDVPEFLRVAETLKARLPRAQRAIVSGAGGFPLWEFPSEVNRLVHRFLAETHSCLTSYDMQTGLPE